MVVMTDGPAGGLVGGRQGYTDGAHGRRTKHDTTTSLRLGSVRECFIEQERI